MYLFLPCKQSTFDPICLQVNYELGYIIGVLLTRNYTHELSTSFQFSYDSKLYSSLETLGSQHTLTYDASTITVQNELYLILETLARYTRRKIFLDQELCQVEEYVKGLRDVFASNVVATRHRILIEYLQRYVWYWFEQRVSIVIYNGDRTRFYFLKII